MTALSPTLQSFFTVHLTARLGASDHTVAAYRDTWRLLLRHLAAETGKAPQNLDFADLTADRVGAFLTYLEDGRHNSVTTCNARLAAIHSMFNYAAYQHPEHAATINRVLAIPSKQHPRADVCYLTPPEVAALLAAPDTATRAGRRDHALIQTAVTTGMRVSELTGLTVDDVHLGTGAHIRCHGKGRKNRTTPLDRQTVAVLRTLLGGRTPGFVFPTRTGTRMSRDAVAARLAQHTATAAATCPSLETKAVSPHTLRHTAAMRLLHAGIDVTVIAIWLGHESISATTIYLHSDMSAKEAALARTKPTGTEPGRYKPDDDTLLNFLHAL